MQPIMKIAMINEELMRLRFGLGMTVLLVSSPLMLKRTGLGEAVMKER